MYDLTKKMFSSKLKILSHIRSEWPSGLTSFRQVNEVKLGRVRSSEVKLRIGDLGGLISQLTSLSFGRDVKGAWSRNINKLLSKR